jgi:heme/copper-type cytochrome/quinol oxidase subunit 2
VAEDVRVRDAHVKIRRPWGVFLLAIVTFGIYYVIWHYKANRELRDYGRSFGAQNPINVDPWVSVLAITLGAFLIIPPFVSVFRTLKRVRTAQELSGIGERISVGLGFLLYLLALILLPFELVYEQRHLNRMWRWELEEAEKARMGMRGEPLGA